MEEKYVCNENFSAEEAVNLNSAMQACIRLGRFLYKTSSLFDPSMNHMLDFCSDWAESYYQILGYLENLALSKMNIDDDVSTERLANYIDDLIKDDNKEFYLNDVLNLIDF